MSIPIMLLAISKVMLVGISVDQVNIWFCQSPMQNLGKTEAGFFPLGGHMILLKALAHTPQIAPP